MIYAFALFPRLCCLIYYITPFPLREAGIGGGSDMELEMFCILQMLLQSQVGRAAAE